MSDVKLELKKRLILWQIESIFFKIIYNLIIFLLYSGIIYYLFLLIYKTEFNINFAKFSLLIILIAAFVIKKKKNFLYILKTIKLSYFSQEVVKLEPDLKLELQPAADFIQNKKIGNEELARAHIEITYKKAKDLPHLIFWKKYFNFKNLILFLASFLLVFISLKKEPSFFQFLNPFYIFKFENYFSIKAENELMENEDFNIKVCPKIYSLAKPYVYLNKTKREGILKYNCWEFKEQNIKEDIKYFLKSGGIKSNKYILKLIKKPEINSIKLIISPPKYLKKENEQFNFIPENIQIIESSILYFLFGNTLNVQSITIDLKSNEKKYSKNIEIFKNKNGEFTFSYIPLNEENIKFYINTNKGHKLEFATSQISIIKDNPPECEIFTDKKEIKIMRGLLYRLNYKVQDDLGIKAIYLIKEFNENKYKRNIMENNNEITNKKYGYYLISTLDFKENANYFYSIQAQDLKGQYCHSEKIKLSISNDIIKHDENINFISQYIGNIQELEKNIKNKNFNIAQNLFKELKFSGENIIKNTENDYFFEKWNKKLIKNAISKIQTTYDNFVNNKFSENEIIENISSAKNDLINAINLDNISNISQSFNPLNNTIEKAEDILNKEILSKEDIEELEMEISKILEEIKQLKEIYKEIEKDKIPKEEKIFNIPLDKMALNAISLNEALKKGDIKSAREYLKKLKDNINQALRVMKEFKEYSYENNQINLQLKLFSEISKKWDEIYQEEKNEFEKNAKFSEKNISIFEEKRKKDIENIKMELFEIKKSSLTIKQLKEIEKNIIEIEKPNPSLISISSSEIFSPLIENINIKISKFSDFGNYWSDDEKAFFKKRLENQKEIRLNSIELKKEIIKTFFDEQILNKLNLAINEMETAENKLILYDISETISAQLKALNYLKQGQDELQKNIEDFKNSFKESSTSIENSYDLSSNNVKIPGKDDYIPQQLIKKEVIKSASEKISTEKKEIMEKYYKNITK